MSCAAYLPRAVLSNITPKLQAFGVEAISGETNSLIGDAETNQPYLKQYNVWGARYEVDRLITSSGWKGLGKWGIQNGSETLHIS